MNNRSLKAKRGFTAVEITIVIAIMAVIMVFSGGLIFQIVSGHKRSDFKSNLNSFRQSIIVAIRNNRDASGNPGGAWAQTMSNNPAPTASLSPFTLYQEDGSVHMNYNPSANAQRGISPEGTVCNTFSSTTPDPNCPARFEFRWRSDPTSCNQIMDVVTDTVDSSCTPDILVEVSLQISAPVKSPFANINPESYGASLKISDNSVYMVDAVCPSGQAVISFDASGEANCSTGASLRAAGPAPTLPVPVPIPVPTPKK